MRNRSSLVLTSILLLQSWGMTVAGTIVQNVLLNKLPQAFLDMLPEGPQIAYGAIPIIPTIADTTLRNEVRHAYAQAMRLVWWVMLGISGAGMLSTLLMREEKMKRSLDDRWGLKEKNKQEDAESGDASPNNGKESSSAAVDVVGTVGSD